MNSEHYLVPLIPDHSIGLSRLVKRVWCLTLLVRTPPRSHPSLSPVCFDGRGIPGEWTSQWELSVYLGADASVEAETTTFPTTSCTSDQSCITILDGGVRTVANAVLSSVGSTPVLTADNPPSVSAMLVAPQVQRSLPCQKQKVALGVVAAVF